MEKPKVINAKECEGCNVPKGWGNEIIFVNNELYCGKLLCFKAGAAFSMHYHMIKDEIEKLGCPINYILNESSDNDLLFYKNVTTPYI